MTGNRTYKAIILTTSISFLCSGASETPLRYIPTEPIDMYMTDAASSVELPIVGLDLSQGFSVDLKVCLASSGEFSPIVSATTDPDVFEDGFSVYATNGRLALFLCGSDGEAALDGGEITCGEWHGVRAVFGADGTALLLDSEEVTQSPAALDFTSLPQAFTIGTLFGDETVAPFAGEISDLSFHCNATAVGDAIATPLTGSASDEVRVQMATEKQIAGDSPAVGEPTPGLAGAAASGTAYPLGGGAGHEDTTKVRRLRKAPGLKLKVSTALE